MDKNSILIFCICAALVCSCTGTSNSNLHTSTPQTAPETVVPAQRKVLISTGTIRSLNEVRVYSRIEGQLLDVNLIDGTSVKKGDLLFSLDDWELEAKYELARSAFDQAQVRMTEILVGQGYRRGALDLVPENILNFTRIKSGLNVCESDLEYNRIRLEQAKITAPVSGVITGIQALSYQFVKPGETLCTIVDPNNLIVVFNVLETEIRKFAEGTVVEVRAIAYNEVVHKAQVFSIGKVVDNSGMVQIQASLDNAEHLLPGMTATVTL